MPWVGEQILFDADADDMASGERFYAGAPVGTSYMPIDGGQVSNDASAPWWAQAPLYALKRYIDSEFPVGPAATYPVTAVPGAPQVGVAADGSIFYRGLPGTVASTLQQVNPMVMFGALSLLALGLYVALKHG